MFSAFRHTLLQLSLGACIVTVSALVTLIDYFPNLNRLDLARLSREVEDKSPPLLSCRLLEQLRISEVYQDLDILNQLSELGLAFSEIVYSERLLVHLQTLERIVNAVGARAKRLTLLDYLEYCMYMTLELRLAARPTKSNTPFLQSIRKKEA